MVYVKQAIWEDIKILGHRSWFFFKGCLCVQSGIKNLSSVL